ncbi:MULTISPECIES: GNAT family N-acetyltransferase [Rhodomicrobium]|uniref:GNAT family N-acetyltransferase n=1 Tax=Rhodomicrobium TaxID=1068 RepID=UPI000B4AF739|nr:MULTISPECIES: GNAT family N-acetyltransferase [Rhodomicrobium]
MTRTNDAEAALSFREATRADLPAVIALLADDPLGKNREMAGLSELPEPYIRAFEAIDADPRNQIIVAETGGEIVGCLQLTYLLGLTYSGGERAQIEGVRVRSGQRGAGIGKALLRHAIDLARERGCVLVQLTSDKRRAEAIAFYGALGFTASHEGLKLRL